MAFTVRSLGPAERAEVVAVEVEALAAEG